MKQSFSISLSKQIFKRSLLLIVSILFLGNFTVNAQCGFTISSDETVCVGESATLTARGALIYQWEPAQGLSTTQGATVTATPLATTTYTVTGTSLFGCVESMTVTVNVNPLPTVTVSGNTVICQGTSTTLTAAGASTYEWGPAIGLSATTGATVTANPTETITYLVTGVSADGCQGATAVTVEVVKSPEVTVTGLENICAGDATPLLADGADTYTWSPAAGLSATTGVGVIASPTTTTTYTVTGTTTAGGCTDTATITITVNQAPTITITGNTNICPGETTTLTAAGADGFIWGPATALNTTVGATIIASPVVTTAYTATGVDATTGCEGTQTVTVNVNTLTDITVSGRMTICNGDSTVITAAGASTYVWAPGATLSATTGTSVTASPTETTTYIVSGTTARGCEGTTSFLIRVLEQPTITAAGVTNICQGDATVLTAAGGDTYIWSPATGLSATTDATVIASPAVTTTYIVTGTNPGGCSGTDTITVTVAAAPVITVTAGDTTICTGEPTTLTAAGADTYVWGPATALNTTTGATIIAAPLQTTTFTVVGTDVASGCDGTATITVTVLPIPVITVTGDSLICIGESTTLTANGASTYTWDSAIGLDTTAGATVIATPQITTTYAITGINADGCIGVGTVTVFVTPQPTIAVLGNTIICNGDSTLLSAIGADSYVWTPGTGLSSTTDAIVMASPTSTTTYDVIGTTAAGCSDTTQITVTVLPSSTIIITGDTTICLGETTELIAAGADNLVWGPITGLNTTIGDTVLVSPVVTTVFTVIGTDSVSGCVATQTVTVTVLPTPEITVEGITEICEGDATTLTARGANTYEWAPAATLNTSTGSVVIATPAITTTYIITGTSDDGCVGFGQVTVTVNPNPIVVVAGNNIICEGDSTLLIAQGADSYVWSPGASLSSTTDSEVMAAPTATTMYTVTGKSTAGCTTDAEFTVIVNPLPVVVAPDDATICFGTTVTLTASGAETYAWEASSGFNTVIGESLIATPFETSTYIVIGISAEGCTATDEVIITLDCNNVSKSVLGVEMEIGDLDTDNSNDGKIFPNPTSGVVNIFPINTDAATTISIIDNSGRIVFEAITNDNASAIIVDLSTEAAGAYVVTITNGTTTLVKKIVKR